MNVKQSRALESYRIALANYTKATAETKVTLAPHVMALKVAEAELLKQTDYPTTEAGTFSFEGYKIAVPATYDAQNPQIAREALLEPFRDVLIPPAYKFSKAGYHLLSKTTDLTEWYALHITTKLGSPAIKMG